MDPRVEKVMEKVNMVTDKCGIVPSVLDKAVDFMKKPMIACIPELVNKITSKFSLVTIGVMALLFVLHCLKNMVISFFFESGPSGLSLGYALIAIVVTLLGSYVIYKTNGIFDKIISGSPCRISSMNIFSILVVIFLFQTITSFIGGIFMAILEEDILLVLYGIGGAIFSFLLALFCATPEDFAIEQDEKVSAGEDLIAILTFIVKLILRLVPIAIFLISIDGIICCIAGVCSFYTESFGDKLLLRIDQMVAEMENLFNFMLIGFIPLAAYFYYLVSYLSLDITRVILSLPQKLDALKK